MRARQREKGDVKVRWKVQVAARVCAWARKERKDRKEREREGERQGASP
jgi:hypothetical protein